MDKHVYESQFSTLPVIKSERNLGLLDSSLINIGWGIATWCFLTGGLLALLVDFKTAVIISFVGNTLGVILAALASTIPSAKYGIDTYTSIISFLGKNGMKIILAIFLITNLGWVVVLASMIARSCQNIYEALVGVIAPEWSFPAITIIAVLLTWWSVVKGPSALKIMNRIMVPGLLVVVVIMIISLISKYDLATIVNAKAIDPYDGKLLNIILVFELCLGAGLSWWPGLGALGRLNKTSPSAFWGNVFGLSFACVAMNILSAAAAYSIGGSDPTTWMIPLGGITLGVIALIFVILANMTSNSYVMYNTCLGLKQFNVFSNRKWIIVSGSFALPAIIISFFPDFVYGNYQMLLNFCVALFGPLSVLQILDYYVFRKQTINLRSIYNTTKSSDYYYTLGVNWAAVIIFVLSIMTYCAILNPVTWEYSGIFTMTTASIPSMAVCLVLYYLYGRVVIVPNNIGNVDYYKNVQEIIEE